MSIRAKVRNKFDTRSGNRTVPGLVPNLVMDLVPDLVPYQMTNLILVVPDLVKSGTRSVREILS